MVYVCEVHPLLCARRCGEGRGALSVAARRRGGHGKGEAAYHCQRARGAQGTCAVQWRQEGLAKVAGLGHRVCAGAAARSVAWAFAGPCVRRWSMRETLATRGVPFEWRGHAAAPLPLAQGAHLAKQRTSRAQMLLPCAALVRALTAPRRRSRRHLRTMSGMWRTTRASRPS